MGNMLPCPVFFTADAAARRGLDFIAITDHNATSQYDALRELQPYFDKLLLIPGREITTFQGHLNFLGTTDFLDFRLGSKEVPDIDTLLRNADRLGGLTSINHPTAPSGEMCMGCGWTPAMPHGLPRKTRGRADRYSFLVGNFHPLLPAGLSRRFPDVRVLGVRLRFFVRPWDFMFGC
jgi:hypothetical protein